MSTFKKAADSAAKLARMLADMQAVSEIIAQCADLEDAKANLEMRVRVENDALAKVRADVEDAKRESLQVLANGKAEAASLLAEAKAKARDIEAKALAHSDKIALDVRAAVDAANAQMAECNIKSQAAIDLVASKQKELDDLEARLARAKAKAAELLGA